MDKIILNDGDGVAILSETKEFLFECCDCGLIHNITVEHKKKSTILRFFRKLRKDKSLQKDKFELNKSKFVELIMKEDNYTMGKIFKILNECEEKYTIK